MAKILTEENSGTQVSTISGHTSPVALYVVSVFFTILACLAIVARLFARTFIAKQAGVDDFFILVAGFLSMAFCFTTYKQTEFGMGLHIWQFPRSEYEIIAMWFWMSVWMYYAALGFTKLSILLQYLRIFPQVNFRRACYAMIGIIALWSVWATVSAIVMCVPIHVFWTAEDFFNDPRCLPRLAVWNANATINILTDCATALLPIRVINSLDMPKRQKKLLLTVFGVGLFTCFISVLRLVYIYPMAANADQTWHSPLLCIWSAVELNVAIICSCTPTLRCLIHRFWPKFLDSVISNYAARRSTGRDDSAATTAVNSDSNVSRSSMFKPGNSYQIEAAGAGAKVQPSNRFQAFRRSLSKPFGSDRPARSAGFDDDYDDERAIDLATYTSSAPSGSGKMSFQGGRDIEVEVEVVVEESSDARSGDYEKPAQWRPC